MQNDDYEKYPLFIPTFDECSEEYQLIRKEEIIRKYMEWIYQTPKFKEELNKRLHDYLDYGII